MPRKPRAITSFSDTCQASWELALSSNEATIPCTSLKKAQALRFELFHYRTAMEPVDLDRWYKMRGYMVQVHETENITHEPPLDPSQYPYVIALIKEEQHYAAERAAANID